MDVHCKVILLALVIGMGQRKENMLQSGAIKETLEALCFRCVGGVWSWGLYGRCDHVAQQEEGCCVDKK